MKKIGLLLLAIGCTVASTWATVTTNPAVIQQGYMGEITIIFNPNGGNKGMKNATACYAHTGISYGGKDWQNTGTWRDGLEKYKMTKNARTGNWELKITPNMYSYYGVAATTAITKLNFVFNDGKSGSLEGKDVGGADYMIDVLKAGLAIQSPSPTSDQTILQGESIQFSFTTTQSATLSLWQNGVSVASTTGTSLSKQLTFANTGTYTMVMKAKTATDSALVTRTVKVLKATKDSLLPKGIELGQNYDKNNPARVTLCMFAGGNKVANNPSVLVPAKAVYVIGEFNQWQISEKYQMYRDSCYFWLTLGVSPGTAYKYQYAVVRADGKQVIISDGFSPVNYEGQTNGYSSELQTRRSAYNWSDATLNFKRPNKNNLVIYELWTYDYTTKRNFAGLMDRLDYIQGLGVNAIELMPICEFDGNYNWGYSPNHYFSIDRQYGTPAQFCQLVDECHKRGIAVIMDMVFNHATGQNPQNKLYPYGSDLAYNPWFNTSAPHSDNVYEDWNHDFPETKKMFTRCLKYWLTEYKVDGFRMDLSHGFCGKSNNAYSNIVDYYNNAIKAVSPDAYFILEHWGANMGTERPQLVNQGMLCWANTNNAYSQIAMGYQTDDNLYDANNDGYVSYPESHDEERNYYKAKTYGSGVVQTNETTRLNRVPMTIGMNVLLNGSHMFYMFSELGYDYSINSTKGSTTIAEGNRTSIKEQPASLGWYTNTLRMAQYEKVAKIINLRTRYLPKLFAGNPDSQSLGSGAVKWIHWKSDTASVFVACNTAASANNVVNIPACSNGQWYDYFTRTQVATGTRTLSAGEILVLCSNNRLAIEDAQLSDQWLTITPTQVLLDQASDVTIYDVQGRTIKKAAQATVVDLSGIPSGFYILQATNGSQQLSEKFYRP